MANLATAPERARNVSTRLQAARLYNDLNHELEHGEYSFEEAAPGEAALQILREAWPGIEDDANDVTDPPKLSHRAGSRARGEHSGEGGGGGGAGAPRAPRPGRRGSGARRGSSSSSSSRSSSGGGVSGRRVVERAAGFSGEDVGSLVIDGLRFLLIAGIAYQVLQPRGANAFASVLNGAGRVVSAVVDPVDPFVALGGRPGSKLPVDPTPAPVLSTATGPAASVSGPGTKAHPNMFQAPFSTFPKVATPFPLPYAPGVTPPRYATGPVGSHVRTPVSPLRIGRNPLGG